MDSPPKEDEKQIRLSLMKKYYLAALFAIHLLPLQRTTHRPPFPLLLSYLDQNSRRRSFGWSIVAFWRDRFVLFVLFGAFVERMDRDGTTG